MFYLHTMVRISNVDNSLKFYCDILGLKLTRKVDSEIRKCEITHSAEINKIFFETLDQINCEL